VDFLLKRPGEFVAIEVKAKPRPGPGDFAGLRAIEELSGLKRRILVHLGVRAFNTAEGIEALPALQFAEELAAGRI
jgi:hypothetical protein